MSKLRFAVMPRVFSRKTERGAHHPGRLKRGKKATTATSLVATDGTGQEEGGWATALKATKERTYNGPWVRSAHISVFKGAYTVVARGVSAWFAG